MKEASTDFQVAFDFLDNFHQFDAASAGERITYHLQRWVSLQQPDPDWIADPLIKRLPDRFADVQGERFLSQLGFRPFDILIFREAIWASDLAKQINAAPLHDASLAEWLAASSKQRGMAAANELETAAKIFDWTVRNIQLESLPYPAENQAAENTESVIPPDGAKYLPAESLILGRGDWMARMRVANLIARQAGLATTVLAIDEDDGAARPWCWAVLIEGQLFLFDFRLGLPIPSGPDDAGGGQPWQGIATLATLIAEPKLLRTLDLTAEDRRRARKYPVQADDLKRIVALMEASPESLSQRMKLVERQLTGARRLILTTAPSALAVDLRNSPGVTGARLWTLPYEVYRFRQDHLESVPAYLARIHADLRIVDGVGPLSIARRQHFRGIYSDTDDEEGAKSTYLLCRVPDVEIEREMDLEEMYRAGMIPYLPPDRSQQELMIAGLRQRMRMGKQYASYWLGLIAFEEGKYQVAVNYLEKRALEATPNGPWTESATYNLARAYEQWGLESGDMSKRETSRELLLSRPKSPQAEGNRLRAARDRP